ncbi:hypothetical protein EXU85_16855 [Spirosoma sp. KCTC 42546]|uniref:hypothetical protein n=1 Tax=Spirosoma sp. KCTC 42546 TaxID=2520506 RepID=UPI0011593405|nr:hypothetical protein [Spirosoma sp. KCTC 42546]QDK80182.1 hypothetical protein EXU85_16855 [Spirosoma sp. KCTC 42546]
MKNILYLVCLFSLGCVRNHFSITQTDSKLFKYIDFCDLPNYKNDLVCIKGEYSGYDEYWSFSPISRKRCSNSLDLELGLNEVKYKNPEFDDKIRQAINNSVNSYLIIEAIGIYTNELKQYGHLGRKNSIFVVQEIVNVAVKKRSLFRSAK